MKLRGQQVKLGRGPVATGGSGRSLCLQSWGFLGALEGRALRRQQAIKAQAGLGGCFNV